MDFTEQLAGLKDLISGLSSKEDAEQARGTILDITERMSEMENRFKELTTMRKVGFDPSGGGLFKTGEDKEAAEFVDWFKSAMTYARTGGKGFDEETVKALNEDTDSAGGYLVPSEFQPRLIRLVTAYGVIRGLATVIPMSGDKLTFPTLVSGVNCYWGSAMGGQAWSVATGGITESQPVFGDVQLAIDDLYCLVPIANQLLDDASIDIANLVITLIAEAVAKEEDEIGLLGSLDEDDPFDGVAYAGINEKIIAGTSYSDMAAEELLDLQDLIEGDDSNGIYVMHRTILNVFRSLKDDNGNFIVQPATASEPATIWGRPYVKSNAMPSVNRVSQTLPFVLFGDFRQLYMGDRKKFTVATSTENQFEFNRTLIRMHERICFSVPLPTAFAGLWTKAGTTTTT